MSAADVAMVAASSEHSEIGHHYGVLLADGSVIAWTEPPFGESLSPGEDDPDYKPICHWLSVGGATRPATRGARRGAQEAVLQV